MGRAPTSLWGRRARDAGLDQKTLATLTGLAPNSVSRGLRGEWESGVPTYFLTIIMAWELLNHDQRETLVGEVKEKVMATKYGNCEYNLMNRGRGLWDWRVWDSSKIVASGTDCDGEAEAEAAARHAIDKYDASNH